MLQGGTKKAAPRPKLLAHHAGVAAVCETVGRHATGRFAKVVQDMGGRKCNSPPNS